VRIAVPTRTAQHAYNAAGDVSRLTSTLNGSTTFAALCAAEQARNRAMVSLRTLGPEIRRLKSEAKTAERDAAKMRERDGFAGFAAKGFVG